MAGTNVGIKGRWTRPIYSEEDQPLMILEKMGKPPSSELVNEILALTSSTLKLENSSEHQAQLFEKLENYLFNLPSELLKNETLPSLEIQFQEDLTKPFTDLTGNSIQLPESLSHLKKAVFMSVDSNPFSSESKSTVLSRVLSSSVGANVENLETPVTISLFLKNQPISELTSLDFNSISCGFWNFSTNSWSNTGCSRKDLEVNSNTSTIITCECNHLTYFGLLLDIYGIRKNFDKNDPKYKAISRATMVGCLLSLICCLLTAFTYIVGNEKLLKRYPAKITLNLVISLLFLYIFFLSMPSMYKSNDATCYAGAALIHLFLLSTLLWMGASGYHMYRSLIRVYFADYRVVFRKFNENGQN